MIVKLELPRQMKKSKKITPCNAEVFGGVTSVELCRANTYKEMWSNTQCQDLGMGRLKRFRLPGPRALMGDGGPVSFSAAFL